jgi:hypothetical protein
MQVRGYGFYAPGFGGGTSSLATGNYNFLTEELRRIKVLSKSQKQIKNATPPPQFIDIPPDKLVKAAQSLPDYVLEGSFPLTSNDAKTVSDVFKNMGVDSRTKEGRLLKEITAQLDNFSTLNPSSYKKEIKRRMGGVHKAAGGKKEDLDFIFEGLGNNYTAEDIISRIYSPSNPALAGKTRGVFAPSNEKSSIGKIDTKIQEIAKKTFGSGFTFLGLNKGGQVPGMQYANIGKMIGKAMGLNADDALGAFGLLKPAVRSGGKTKIPKNLTMKEIFDHKEFKEGIYLVQPEGGKAYEASLYYFNGKPRLQRHGQYNVGSGMGTRTRQFDPIDVDPNMRASIYNRNEYTGSNVSGPFKANKGNIVPGTGNTDTVPAMLTPGEFVINKESTKQNYDLLTAINNGKMNKYNKGGVASGIQYFAEENPQRVVQPANPKGYQAARGAAGMVGSMLPFMVGNMGPMQSMAASIIGMSVASKATGVAMKLLTGRAANVAGEFKLLGNIITKLGPGLTGTLGIGGAAITLGIALNNMAKKTTQAGSDFVNAMYGSSNTMAGFAKSMGRENIQQQLTTKRAETAGGGAISQESKQFSTQFLETDAGKGLLENVSTVTKEQWVKKAIYV